MTARPRRSSSPTYRTKFVDYDARRPTVGDGDFCIRCQKPLKPGQPRRWVHCVDGGTFALHPADEALYAAHGDPAGEMGWWPLGTDCARKVGLEWTHAASIEP